MIFQASCGCAGASQKRSQQFKMRFINVEKDFQLPLFICRFE